MDSLDTNALASALKQRGLFDKAREVLRQYAEQQQQNPGLPSRDVFDLLADAGLVNAVSEAMLESGVDPATLKRITTVERVAPAATIDEQRTVRPAERLAAEPALPASAASSPPARAIRPVSRFAASVADPSRPQLLIRFGKGKAFVPPQALSGDIEVAGPTSATAGDVDAAMAMEAAQGVKRAYVLHALCCGQRFQSDPVPVSLEPDFSVSSPAAVLGPAVTDDGVPTAPSASTEPHFVVDLQPMLKKESPSEAGGSVGAGTLSRTTAAAFTRVDTLPVTRKILQGTTLESSGLHLILTLVTDKTNKGNNKGSKSNRVDSDSSTAATTADVSVDIVASHSLDWRTIVSSESGYLTSLVPLTPAGPGPHPSAADGSGNRIPVGLLNLQLYLRPLQPLNEIVPRYDAEFTLSRSLALQRDSSQAFLGYAKRWWREYKEVHPSFRDRPVKIFGESEKGEFLPVCSYVTPLSAGRLLESPHHAARFVALIPFKQEETLGSSSSSSFSSSASPSGRKELWYSPHVTLALRQGDVEAHAVLLCSLFCGFGLEAYCASGTRIDAEGVEHEYCWVVTRYATTVPAPASSSAGGGGGDEDDGADRTVTVAKVTFWDPLTGQASSPLSGASAASAGGSSSSSSGAVASGFRYYRISSLFNHCSFYANHALNDSVAAVRWGDWNDHTQWKSVSGWGRNNSKTHAGAVQMWCIGFRRVIFLVFCFFSCRWSRPCSPSSPAPLALPSFLLRSTL